MIYYKLGDDYEVLQFTHSELSAKDYELDLVGEDYDIVQAYNNRWYLRGHEPQEPQSEINAKRVRVLKKQLEDTDYKIVKCSEYQLAGLEPPYDIQELHAERQAIRDEINELENYNG